MAAPVRGVAIRGLELRDTRLVSLDAHGMPSGGDWALQRSGAIFLEGTEACSVTESLLTMLDGNGVFLSLCKPPAPLPTTSRLPPLRGTPPECT